MIRKSPHQGQKDLLHLLLQEFINMDHELVVLAQEIDWVFFETAFAKYYSHTGQPGMPIRFMVAYLLLKWLYNLGDESIYTVF